MENDVTKQKVSVLKKLGIYQLIGGVVGLLFIAWGIKDLIESNVLVLLLFVVMALLFGYSVFCGVMCLRRHGKALTFSMVNQLLQVIGFVSGGYGFSYTAGIYFTFKFDLIEFPGLSFGLGVSRCNIDFNSGNEQAFMSVNIIAIWVFYEILILVNALKEEERDRQINSLGEEE